MLYEDSVKRPSSYLERTEKNMIEVYKMEKVNVELLFAKPSNNRVRGTC